MLSLVVIVAAAACGDTPTTPGGVSALSQTDLVAGAGAVAASGNSITVNYTGWLYDPTKPENKGTQFDTSAGRGALTVTPGSVIAGFERGIVGMRVGGLRRVTIPPELGYGATARTGIPANSTLVFEIELLQVN